MANRYDDYMNRRSYLVDTAETPKDKKALKNDLKKLDKAMNFASRSPRIAPMQSSTEAARQDKALRDLMAKREAEAKRTGRYPNYNTN
jgi:hypothetical protein